MADQPKPNVKIAKHDTVPTLFADGLFGASVTSGVVRLEVFADHFEPTTGALEPTIVGRLMMPSERLEAFARGITELVQQIQTQKKKQAEAAATKSPDIKLASGLT